MRLVGMLDLAFPEYSTAVSNLFGATSREVLAQFPTAEALAHVDVERLTQLLKKASNGQLGRAKANQLKQAAQQSFALRGRQETLALEIRFLVERLNVLLSQTFCAPFPGWDRSGHPLFWQRFGRCFTQKKKTAPKPSSPPPAWMPARWKVASGKAKVKCPSGAVNTCGPPLCRRPKWPSIEKRIPCWPRSISARWTAGSITPWRCLMWPIKCCMSSFLYSKTIGLIGR